MYNTSPLSPEDYRNAVKASLNNLAYPFSEHFSGFFIGNAFYLAHHSQHELGHNNTPQCAAVGYMKKTEHGTALHYLTFRGLFCPMPFLMTLILSIGFCLMINDPQNYPWKNIFIGIGIALVIATVRTCAQVFYKRSEDGYNALMELMDDPIAPFRNE